MRQTTSAVSIGMKGCLSIADWESRKETAKESRKEGKGRQERWTLETEPSLRIIHVAFEIVTVLESMNMRLSRSLMVSLLLFVLFASNSAADEGMWLPEQLPELAERLQELGLEIDPGELADLSTYPLGAVVSLGGCSASFVSAQGLVVTNHHCVSGALSHNSSAEQNLHEEGFIAADLSEERWAGPGSRVFVTESLTDVTEQVLGSLGEEVSDADRFAAIDRTCKELVAECEQTDGYRCEVVKYDGGAEFRLMRQLELRDVRLVLAPPSSVGDYGGDIDNWMWPRHSGDFAFFRAYVGPDGAPAVHAPENRPYEPVHHLTVSRDGLSPGDFVMVAGYPWETSRHLTAGEMVHQSEVATPWEIATMNDLMVIIAEVGAVDEDSAVRLTSFESTLANYLKYNQGLTDGFLGSGVVERARQIEADLRAWLPSRGETGEGWTSAMDELDAALAADYANYQRDVLLGWMVWSADVLNSARTAYWLAVEREKPDLERDAGYQERDWPRVRERVERLEAGFVAEADRRYLTYFLARAADLPDGQRIEAVDTLLATYAGQDDPVAAAVTDLMERTSLTDAVERSALLDRTRAELEASEDPIVAFAVHLYPLMRQNKDDDKVLQGAISRLRPVVLEALRAVSPGPVYPDANASLRVTIGSIMGYDGADAIRYLPFTQLAGIVEKHTGEEPFDAPDRLLEAITSGDTGPYVDERLGSVPVNFLSDLDSTGGNSGSPTLNARGELCGLLFDGNYESMSSDWLFDPVKTRSIHVDIRYVLWWLDRIDSAGRLLQEMGIEPTFVR